MDVLGGDAIGEDGVGGGDSFLRARSDAGGTGLIGRSLDSTLQLMLEVEFKKEALQLHCYRRHFSMFRIHKDSELRIRVRGFQRSNTEEEEKHRLNEFKFSVA